MSADEDTELRDLVAQTLESSGVLGKIRAELRASVFLALEEQDAVQNKTPFINQELKKFLTTKEGVLATSLLQEFLELFHLDFTLAVFNPETNFGEKYEGRDSLAKDLGLVDSEKTRGKPLLCELLRRANEQSSRSGLQRSHSNAEDINIPKDLTAVQIADAKQKFDFYDADKSGSIDKDELRNLFIDMFPHFHRNMLERYVNDEFRAGDKDFSSGIDFDEFLGMYRRLFVVCRSVVSSDVADISPQSQRRLSDSMKHSVNLKPITARQNNSSNETDSSAPQSHSAMKEKTDTNKQMKGRQRSLSAGSDVSEDSFFDDIPAPSRKPLTFSSMKTKKESPPQSPPKTPPPKSPGSGMSSLFNAPPLAGKSGMGSLAGAPPLPGKGGPRDTSSPDWKDLKALDNKLDKLSFDVSKSEASEDYEDDFQSSQDSQSQAHTAGNKSQKSNEANSVSEEISEEIQDDFDISGDDDFLASSQDKLDELTTDRSVSQISGRFDYIEDAQLEF
ncbi:centrosomal protein 43-like [Patiria miniata]|uniref:EF-hand domain-containing protein n=1 Tax=Patiria miniata TaxID=46514 RepID=A0A914BMI8_PATMI|nr:centrosomal protein 43-like [Patiria miniata]